MHLLWLSWKDPTHPDAGGAEIYGRHLAESLVRQQHTVTWISTGYQNCQKTQTLNGIDYHHLGQKWMFKFGLFHLLIFWIYFKKFKKKIDIVIDEAHGPPFLTPLFVKQKKILVVHEVAGDIWQKMLPFPVSYFGQYILDPLFFSFYKNTPIITVSPSTKADLIKLKISPANISIIYNGIDQPRISLSDINKESDPTIIFFSALRPMKGFDRVFNAVKQIKAQIPRLQFWVVGDNNSSYARDIIKNITYENQKWVKFFGNLPERQLYQTLPKAHLLVHGSYKEGWGRVVIEANYFGLPAVVFDAPGLRDSVLNNKTGFITQDQNEFVEKVLLLLNSRQIYSDFRISALEWARKFSWESTEREFTSLVLDR